MGDKENYIKFLRQILTAGVGIFVFNKNKQVLMQLRTDYNQWGFPVNRIIESIQMVINYMILQQFLLLQIIVVN